MRRASTLSLRFRKYFIFIFEIFYCGSVETKSKNELLLKIFPQGCSSFDFNGSGFGTARWDSYESWLTQRSMNPSVYMKLSCFLPWVAAQYNMDYTPPGDTDPACLTGNGDITEVTAEVCRTNPYNSYLDQIDGIEAVCLFPFTLNGVSHDTCILDQITNFTRPIFRCPIRTVKGAGPNGTDYTDDHLTAGVLSQGEFCPTNS